MKSLIRSILIVITMFFTSSINAQYTLVWEDNFDGASLDSSIWNIEEKEGIWNTGSNSELQHYRKENVSVGDDGSGNNCLILTAKEEDYNGYNYTSGKVTTKGKLAFKRGKLEAYIKIPDLENGLWPAFWTLGYTTNGWPSCGEIDILEMGHEQGISDDTVNSYIGAHLFWTDGTQADFGNEMVAAQNLSNGYFKYTLEWTETSIKVYFNDAVDPYFSMGISGAMEEFTDYQHYIILNMAVGGAVPNIYNKSGITVPFPASMYIDWVKVYQETGSEDINDSSLVLFGDYGVYEETKNTTISMTKGFDLFENTTGLTSRAGETAYEGTQSLSYDVINGQDFELKLKSGLIRNFSRYNEGSIQLHIKSELSDDIQIGLADTSGNEKFFTLSASADQNFTRDGEWELVYISLADVLADVDIEALEDLLIVKASPTSSGYISIDQVIYSEELPVSSYYGIYTDNTNISDGFIIDNVAKNLYVWNNTVTFNTVWSAYEGDDVLSFKSNGNENWYGFGFNSTTPIDLSVFEGGYLNISIRTISSGDFYLGMTSNSTGVDAKVYFTASSNPYGFVRNGEWNHLKIPLSDFIDQGLNLSSINQVFITGGDNIGDIAYDDIYLSETSNPITNSGICYAYSLEITPRNTTVSTNQLLAYSATVFNQFGNPYDKDVTWSSTGGTIRSNGLFDSDTEGSFVITASQAGKSVNTNVYVNLPSSIALQELSNFNTYYNKDINSLVITGLTDPSRIALTNISGQQVYNGYTNQSDFVIDMGNQKPGMYILQVSSATTKYVSKIVNF